jgi:hypothetical protein
VGIIQFRCECGKLLQAREEQAGLPAACPICGHVTAVPMPPDAPRYIGVTPEPVPLSPPEAPERSQPPALHPEPGPAPANRSPVRAVLVALFVIGVVALGVYLGWRRTSAEAVARRVLEAELPKQNNIRVRSIDLKPLPPERGGEKGDFTGTVTDQDGRVWDLIRVRVRGKETMWVVREPEEKLRQWVEQHVATKLDAKVKSIDFGRTADGRRTGKVTTTNGLVLDLEEEPVGTAHGKLTAGATKLQLNSGSVTRSWELQVMKQYPGTKSVTLKEDSEGSWSGTATDDKGRRYTVSIKALPEESGKERQYNIDRRLIEE